VGEGALGVGWGFAHAILFLGSLLRYRTVRLQYMAKV